MSWSISQVAKLSGTTSRTLRHYDAIGLLRPAAVGANGYRYYEREDLLRLQEILLLRALGLGLDSIAEVINGRRDRTEALSSHRQWLLAEQERLGRLAATIAETINELRGGEEMSGEALFDGFAENPYEAEAIERWGKGVVDESTRRRDAMSPEQRKAVQEGWLDALADIEAARRGGVAADDPAIADAVDKHHMWLLHSWTPNAEAYTNLGHLYASDERFRTTIDADGRDGLAEYLAVAMATYATLRLA